ncbi:MAG: phosphoribosyltransferase family protein, partial [Clostridia bacterium]|nr:phosphoribosyltransferase family protein [Clostridia bacterium]
ERENGVMTLRRGFAPHVTKGMRVLVTEDVLTTGGSAQEVVALLQEQGAEVIGAASIIDRTHGNQVKLTVPYRSLISLEAGTYPPEDCPLCAKGAPINKPGSRPGL